MGYMLESERYVLTSARSAADERVMAPQARAARSAAGGNVGSRAPGEQGQAPPACREQAVRALEARIAEICGTGRLEAHFQPIVNLDDGAVAGVECLARWRRADGRLVAPAAFMPTLEMAGDTRALTGHMIGLALDGARRWWAAGQCAWVSVNTAADDLLDPQLAANVADQLASRGLPPNALALEVTERQTIDEPERAIRTLRKLRAAGVRIGLDDFGTGLSSLERLVELPLDAVKIDRAFVVRMTHSAAHAHIVRAVVELGHRLGLTVVAEGVEDRRTLKMVRELGADRVQGFLCAAPVAADQIVATINHVLATRGAIIEARRRMAVREPGEMVR